MSIEDIYFALAHSQTVLLGVCAPSSVVSVASGWLFAAVGFVVVLQRYRSCGPWTCPGGLVARHGVRITCGGALLIKSSFLDQTQVPEIRTSKPKHGVSTSTPKCKR